MEEDLHLKSDSEVSLRGNEGLYVEGKEIMMEAKDNIDFTSVSVQKIYQLSVN